MTFGRFITIATLAILPVLAQAQEVTVSRVADLNPGSVGSFPSNFITFNGGLYFSAYTFELGRELFKYDGANTLLVSNINDQTHLDESGAQLGNDSIPSGFTLFNGALYFSAYDQRRGGELWKYDGSAAVRVADIHPDRDDFVKIIQNSSWPQELTVMGNTLYFSADGGVPLPAPIPVPNYELWKYDGVRATLVTNIHPNVGTNYSSYPHELTVFNNALYFSANDGTNGYELWKCDGTHAVLFANINPGNGSSSSFPKYFTPYKSALYFQAFDDVHGFELWKTDGTATSLVSNINPTGSSLPRSFTIFKDILYFAADDGARGFELWEFNGAAATLAADINPAGDSSLKNLTVFGDHLYFAADDGVHGWELWKYDGVSASMVADLNPDGDSFPEEFTIMDNRLWFTASNSVVGYELWVTDGRAVSLAADILPGPPSSFPLYLAPFGSRLCFSANDNYYSDWELWTASFRPFRITKIEQLGSDIRLTWTTLGGTTNIVQSSDDLTGFTDLSGPLLIPGLGEVSASYTDHPASAGRNRFYRIIQRE
jgi:ELWxxDGT repeat protein